MPAIEEYDSDELCVSLGFFPLPASARRPSSRPTLLPRQFVLIAAAFPLTYSDDDTDLPLPSAPVARASSASSAGAAAQAPSNPMAGLQAMMEAMGAGGLADDPQMGMGGGKDNQVTYVEDDSPYKESVSLSDGSKVEQAARRRLTFRAPSSTSLCQAGTQSTPCTSMPSEHSVRTEAGASRARRLTGGRLPRILCLHSRPFGCPSSSRRVAILPSSSPRVTSLTRQAAFNPLTGS